VQRILEKSGIPTIIISALPDISIRCGAPRSVSPIVPIGANAGAPNKKSQQEKILLLALENLVSLDSPGQNIQLSIEY
jgi:D-proline reductase (dithiol) PrdB